MKVLLIGSGGREHALAWGLTSSPHLSKLYVAPGNAGIAELGECISLDITNHAEIINFCQQKAIDLVIIGPEAPLVAGLVDDLNAAGFKAFGPTKAAAQLEASKSFTKDLCTKAGIPTAAYRCFQDAPTAKEYLHTQTFPVVVKVDGLAAGKGVVIAMAIEEAIAAIDACFDGTFGKAGSEVVIEAFLQGEEASFFVLTDGKTILPMATAQDHKRVGDGDTGPNTGGMGAYSPAPIINEILTNEIMQRIIKPTIAALADKGIIYKGILYAGLMITEDGPKLIEYNVRFGDPECQVLMMRLQSDMLQLMLAVAEERLDQCSLHWSNDAALTVVMAANGYPGSYEKGSIINDLTKINGQNIKVFHAGTTMEDGHIKAIGGRVLNITARGQTIQEARDHAYNAVTMIDWPQGFYRQDIGWRAI